MVSLRVINRYAEALLKDAIKQNMLEEVYRDALVFIQVCEENREFYLMLKKPIIQHKKKQSIILKAFEPHFNKLTLDFTRLMVAHKREVLLKETFQHFIELYKEKKNILDAKVVSAIPLSDELMDKVRDYIGERSGSKEVVINNTVDKNIIGGFTLSYQDKLIDASVRNQLKTLKQHLTDH